MGRARHPTEPVKLTHMSSNVNSKHRLLLVDDEHLVLVILSIGLSRVGYIVKHRRIRGQFGSHAGEWRAAGSGHP